MIITFKDLAAPIPSAADGVPPSYADILRWEETIPASARELDGKRVALDGLLVPLRSEGHTLTLLAAIDGHTGCCLPNDAPLNGWILGSVVDPFRVPYVVNRPVRLHGELSVGEEYAHDRLSSLYRLRIHDAEVLPPAAAAMKPIWSELQ